MNKEKFCILIFMLFQISSFAQKAQYSTAPFSCVNEKLPNIVLIFIDDMGYADISSFGATDYKTPNIDKIGDEGIKFTDFYASQAVCSASRASLLTGCYAERVGISGALMPWSNTGINQNETTIADMLNARGYATAIIGKWHLGDKKQFLPLQNGFDEYFGLPYSNDMWPVDYDGTPLTGKGKRHSNYPPLPLIDGNDVVDTVSTLSDQGMLTYRYTEKAVDFIERHKSEPFFLYLPYSMVHVPIAVSDKFKNKSGKGLFADVMLELDWSIGKIMNTLKETGIDKNTIVIFTSDNGPWLNFGNHAGSAFPLREGKGTMWEGGPRVSALIRWPGKIPEGIVSHKIVSTIDILPTIAEITGAELPKNKIDGVSILPILIGDKKATPRDVFYYYYGNNLIAVRKGKWKLVFPHSGRTYMGFKPGKDGYPGKTGILRITKPELYDLENDISETKNLISLYPEIAAELNVIADSARLELGDKLLNIKGRGVRKPGTIKQEKTVVENIAKGKKIKIKGTPGFQYSGSGDKTLINGILGSFDFKDGESLGFEGQDIEILIDLEEVMPVNFIECSFMENQRAWIFRPEKVEVEVSLNGEDYNILRIFTDDETLEKQKTGFVKYKISNISLNIRFIKIKVYSLDSIPDWHPGAGGKPWVFADEIIVH